jgi:hypothetical protein
MSQPNVGQNQYLPQGQFPGSGPGLGTIQPGMNQQGNQAGMAQPSMNQQGNQGGMVQVREVGKSGTIWSVAALNYVDAGIGRTDWVLLLVLIVNHITKPTKHNR